MDEYCQSCGRRSRICNYCSPRPRSQVSTQTEVRAEFSLYRCLDSGDLTDVEFVVEPSHFPGNRAIFKAHKMILAVQNDLFRAMFYGALTPEDRVVITDLHPDGFRGLLRYFYSGCLEAANVLQAARIRTAAAKYLVPELDQRCLSFINDYMELDDVCPFLDYVFTMGEVELAVLAATVISRDSVGVISSSGFPLCTEHTVRFVLRNAINVPEVSVVRAVYDWAQNQWLLHFAADGRQREGIRPIMQPLFSELRFLALTPNEFTDGPIAWKIFTVPEALAILGNIVRPGSVVMPEGFCQIRSARTHLPLSEMFAQRLRVK